jgi:ribosomal protein L11 methyltransferase
MLYFYNKVCQEEIMGYYELNINVPDDSKELLINLAAEAGCLGVSETGNTMLAYFPDNTSIEKITDDLASIKAVIKKSGMPHDISYSYIHMPDQDWNETWKKAIQPINVGEDMIILPPWDSNETDRMALIIDPGMAFGTGHHETTRFCLVTIERLSRLSGKGRFLDVGTGTGILAIAARKFGFGQAVGVDTDPLAVDAAKRNAALNNFGDIEIYEGGIEKSSGLFNLVAANLLSGIIISIAEEIEKRMAPDAIALLSGIMAGQEDDVIAAFAGLGLRAGEKLPDGNWVSLVIRR